MGILPWSLGFSLIVAILCWSQFGKVHEEHMLHNTIVNTIDSSATSIFCEIEEQSNDLFKMLCPECKDSTPEHLARRQTKHSAPLSKKLHISSLVSSKGGAEKQTQELIFRRLISVLYGSQPLFYPDADNEEEIQQLFDELFEQVLELEAKFPIKKPDFFGNIEFAEPNKHQKEFIKFLLFKGGKGEIFSRSPCELLPLGDYIEVKKRKQCMSVYLAPRVLLQALFQNDETVCKVLDTRVEIYNKLVKVYKDDRSKIDSTKEELTATFKQFETCLPSDIDPTQIDFNISTTRPKEQY
jgi:hypothetical protein